MIIKNLFYVLLFLNLKNSFAAEECAIDFNKYKTQAPIDCAVCQNDMAIPSDKVEKLMSGLINFVEESNDETVSLRKLKVMSHFLQSKKNAQKCSNYKAIKKSFKEVFQQYLASCEKGPQMTDIFNKRKAICEWTLDTYSLKITSAFYSYWTIVGPKGELSVNPKRHIEDLEGSIRAHEVWCRQVKKSYKNTISIDCIDVKNWVADFDLVKKVNDSMKHDMESRPSEDARKKSIMDGCKYFDSNPSTTLTKDLYLACNAQ